MKKPYWILIGITGAFLCLIIGIFIGRNLTNNYVSVDNLGKSDANVDSIANESNTNKPQGDSNTNNNVNEPQGDSDTGNGDSATNNSTELKDGKVNINTADAKLLAFLPGIGDVIAQRIVDYRTKSGPFKSVDELINVSGIGEKKLEQLRPYVKIE